MTVSAPRCPLHQRPLVAFCPACRGAQGGTVTSPAKQASARRNGAMGGRPRKETPHDPRP